MDRYINIYCVLGNSWGVDRRGRGCMGCGNQEEFWNCADIQIGSHHSTSGFSISNSQESEEKDSSLSGIQLLNQWFSLPGSEHGLTWSNNQESDSDESEDRGSWSSGTNTWSGNMQSKFFDDFDNLHSVVPTRQPSFSSAGHLQSFAPTQPSTSDSWQRMTTLPPVQTDPWSQLTGRANNRHSVLSNSNILQNTQTQQQSRHNSISDGWTLLWQPPTKRNPSNNHNSASNSVKNTRNQNSRNSTNRMTRNRNILAPISPLMALLGGSGSQVHFSFLPEDDLQRLNFLG